MNIAHKAGQVVGACLFCFLSQEVATWHPSGGKCAERKLSTGSESAPVLPTSGLNGCFVVFTQAAQPVNIAAGPSSPW